MDAYQRLVLGFLTDSHGGNVPYRHGRVRDWRLDDGEMAGEKTSELTLRCYNVWSPEKITETDEMDDLVFNSISYRVVDEFTNKK